MLGVKIHKHRERRDGEAIYLVSFIGNDTSLFLCHLNALGEIVDSKYFGCSGSVERIVRAQALHEYNIWKQILMCHIDDYEFAPSVLMRDIPDYVIPPELKYDIEKLKA